MMNNLNDLKIDIENILSSNQVIGERLSVKTTNVNNFLVEFIKILKIHKAYKLKSLRPA